VRPDSWSPQQTAKCDSHVYRALTWENKLNPQEEGRKAASEETFFMESTSFWPQRKRPDKKALNMMQKLTKEEIRNEKISQLKAAYEASKYRSYEEELHSAIKLSMLIEARNGIDVAIEWLTVAVNIVKRKTAEL
jgi:hypothetical protein